MGVNNVVVVWRNDQWVFVILFVDIVEQDWQGVDVIYGNVEEVLNLFSVQIYGQYVIYVGGDQYVGDQFGGDGYV